MAVQAFLGRSVVVGRDDEGGIRAGRLGGSRLFDRRRRTIRSGAGHHGHASGGTFDADADEAVALRRRQRRTFAGVPQGTRPCVPAPICHSTKLANAFSSRP